VPDPLTNSAAPAQPVQGPAPAPAVLPPQGSPPAPVSPPSGLADYDLGNTDITFEEPPVAAMQASAPPPLPPRDPQTGQFTKPAAPEIPAASAQHSQYLINLAKDMGFTDYEIAQSPRETLERDIYVINRRLRAEARQEARADAVQSGGQSADGGAMPPSAPVPEPEWDDEELDDGAGNKVKVKDALHPSLTKIIGKLVKQNKELAEAIKHLSAAENNRQAETFYTAIDRLFISRPELFGDKTATQLKPDDPHMRKRAAIVRLMKTFDKGTMQERWQAAVRDLYGDSTPPASPAARPPAPAPSPAPAPQNGHSRITPEQWDAGSLAAPTHRNGAADPPGTEKATKALAAKLRELDATDDEAADANFRP
jgi:hypothetical protein